MNVRPSVILIRHIPTELNEHCRYGGKTSVHECKNRPKSGKPPPQIKILLTVPLTEAYLLPKFWKIHSHNLSRSPAHRMFTDQRASSIS